MPATRLVPRIQSVVTQAMPGLFFAPRKPELRMTRNQITGENSGTRKLYHATLEKMNRQTLDRYVRFACSCWLTLKMNHNTNYRK
jgi:hypothetical protein